MSEERGTVEHCADEHGTVDAWYRLQEVHKIASPALVIDRDRVERNIARMVAIAGDARRLRPHVKTHKMAEVVRLQQRAGIERFKCATLAEAKLAADCEARDVLLAYQPVGPAQERLVRLAAAHPQTRFSVLIDDGTTAEELDSRASAAGVELGVYLDLDIGMHRTGIAAGPHSLELARQIHACDNLRLVGLHAYDGHIKEPDPGVRQQRVEESMAPAIALRDALMEREMPVTLLAGGTPTFATHALHADRELSPGTCVFWDASYQTKYGDLNFEPAAFLVTRVISRPSGDRICLDLGYKAVACDNPDPRVWIPELADARMVVHSEEHLTLETNRAEEYRVGDVVYGIPYHVCPTVALYPAVLVSQQGRIVDRWPVAARDRHIEF
jgi:D-serine deaminase-like pyridoxal phosphate-dependent protein